MAKGRAQSGPLLRPRWISYPENFSPLAVCTALAFVKALSPMSVVSMSRSPRPSALPLAPSRPSGSCTVLPSIWYPPQSPKMRLPCRAAARRSMSHPCCRRNFRSPMVDLVPGIRIKSASAGRGCPGWTMTTRTPGVWRSGSRSSKFAMRERRGTAMMMSPVPGVWKLSRATASSAGNLDASAKCGMTPAQGRPVRFSISFTPSSNSEASPWKLLTMKQVMASASCFEMTLNVPTSEAMTPPR